MSNLSNQVCSDTILIVNTCMIHYWTSSLYFVNLDFTDRVSQYTVSWFGSEKLVKTEPKII